MRSHEHTLRRTEASVRKRRHERSASWPGIISVPVMNAGHLLVITGFARLSEIAGTRPAMTEEDASPAQLVMAGHSRPKDGVLSRAYVPAISFRKAKLCHPERDHRHKAGDDS